ncbi:MAG: damage-inducible protein CinA [Rickettsiales bacterium]|nr:damage-inducible protein CinA [Rickettsiales bacterium]
MTYAFPKELNNNAKMLIHLCRQKNIRLSTIESCTGGLLAGCLTDIAGSSDVLDRGFVTYSNEAKNEEVGVNLDTLEKFGAVSAPVAREMCAGALTRRPIGAAASLTGIAGPGGATANKPVGLVFIGIATRSSNPVAHRFVFEGDRQAVRTAAVAEAINLLISAISGTDSR